MCGERFDAGLCSGLAPASVNCQFGYRTPSLIERNPHTGDRLLLLDLRQQPPCASRVGDPPSLKSQGGCAPCRHRTPLEAKREKKDPKRLNVEPAATLAEYVRAAETGRLWRERLPPGPFSVPLVPLELRL